MPAAVGLAAYARLRHQGLLEGKACENALRQALTEPLDVGGAWRRYRFPVQKARHLAGALTKLETFTPPRRDRALRDALTRLPGVGLKTASWIVRNHRGSDRVAIIDIHILRAGRLAGAFPIRLVPARDYRELERRFLAFAKEIGVPASVLDALIWDYMRRLPIGMVGPPLNADDCSAAGAKAARRSQGVKRGPAEYAEGTEP